MVVLFRFVSFWFLNKGNDDVGKLLITQGEGCNSTQADAPSSSDTIIPEC